MATTSSNSSLLSISGLATGFDWKSVVTQLANAERLPETTWQQTQSTINQKNNAFGSIKSYLNNLQADAQALKDPTLYTSSLATTSDSTIASATAASSATIGTFTFNITQLATAAQINGTNNIGKPISQSGDLTAVTLGDAGFSTAATAGTFTVNGKQITVATTDTLQQVFDKISTATGNKVTAGYNTGTDEITLASADSSEVILGSAADTSNFLQAAQLYNNGTGSVTSTAALGRVRLTDSLSSAKLTTAITDGGSGAGQFSINGIAINYNSGNDNIQNVLDRINTSSAGVNASYDSQNDRFVLTNKVTGDVGIALQDDTGNFLAATGLSGGALSHGKNLLYTLNGGTQQLVSQSNTITQDSSNIPGLNVNVLTKGIATVTVGNDTSKVKTAIQNFIKDYNSIQSYIGTQNASSTDSTGKVTAGILASDQDANGIASSLRSLSFAPVPGLSGALNQLASLGIQTNGKDNTIQLSDSSALDTALAGNLNDIKNLFSDSTNGLATKLDTYLTNTVGDAGTLTNHQTNLTKQSAGIDTQIANLEKTITADSAHWTTEFQAMETAQAAITQQTQYLTQAITNGTL
jgi:flagellar hook-associated protein 2